jgi:hypothetical protein
MLTNQVVTRSIGLEAAPTDVLAVLGDPGALHQWAPRFAERAVAADADRWTISSGRSEFEIRVVASARAGTVDYLAADDDRGLFTRVVPGRTGSALTLTLVLPAEAPADLVDRERGVLEQELRAVRDLVDPDPEERTS